MGSRSLPMENCSKERKRRASDETQKPAPPRTVGVEVRHTDDGVVAASQPLGKCVSWPRPVDVFPRFVEKERRPPLRHQSIISGGNLRVFENLAQTLVAVDAS